MSTVEAGDGLGADAKVAASVSVVETVAAADGTDPRHLDPPLETVVDCDALDALFAGGDAGPECHVELSYKGYTVRVDGDGDATLVE